MQIIHIIKKNSRNFLQLLKIKSNEDINKFKKITEYIYTHR